jgi:thiamine-phosphate pyrophosphorylase
VITLPRLYAIIDFGCFSTSDEMLAFADELSVGGCTLMQYRNKRGNAREILQHAKLLRTRLSISIRLIMNDRADLCVAARFEGVHLGQGDLSPESARSIVGQHAWVGVSTHNPRQVEEAQKTSADYIAIGPVFSTNSKDRPDPVVGLDGVRRARALTNKALVAIGGITPGNCGHVIEAGADSVAVISGLLPSPRKSTEDFFRILR